MIRASSSRRSRMPLLIVAQDRAALVGRHAARYLERRDRRLDRLLVLLVSGVVGRPCELSGPCRVGDLEQSGESTQRPARKIGCGLVAASVIAAILAYGP